MALGESDQRRDVGGGDRHVFQIGFQRGAGIARRNVDFIRQRRLGGFQASACSRPPLPIIKMFIRGSTNGVRRSARGKRN